MYINTKNILFIASGAFVGLEDSVKRRMGKHQVGFGNIDTNSSADVQHPLDFVSTDDICQFGMIPEFLGRLPIICTLDPLSEEMLVRILKEPKNAIIKQYQKLLALDEVNLVFDDDALHAIAVKAKERKLGARALRAIIEEFMLDIMYEVPKDDDIGTVTITADYVNGQGGPRIEMRTQEKTEKLPQESSVSKVSPVVSNEA